VSEPGKDPFALSANRVARDAKSAMGPPGYGAEKSRNVAAAILSIVGSGKPFPTKVALARAMGISPQALSQIVRGTNGPSGATVDKLATLLGQDAKTILAGEAVAAVVVPAASVTPKPGAPGPSEGTLVGMATMIHLREMQRCPWPAFEAALAFFAHDPHRWSPMTLDFARRGQFLGGGCARWTSPQWVEALDRLEQAVRRELSGPKDAGGAA
jgi:Helix-turn-helix